MTNQDPGTDGIIKKIRDRVGTETPIYLSIDIDTLDPACK
jgi:agmatinase